MKTGVKIIAMLLTAVMLLPLFAACSNKVENFELSFVVNGEIHSKITTNGKETISIPDDPSKDGYTFDGWYWDEGIWSKPFTANSLLDAPISSNMAVHAKFDAIKYTITYETNGGTHQNPVSYTIEDAFALTDAQKEGYDFLGWFDANDQKVTDISVGSMGDISLKAQYSPSVYDVIYENTKDAVNSNPSSYTIETNTIILSDLVKDGYTFDGWYNGETKVTEIPKGSIGNLTLTAKWDTVGYQISYNNLFNAENSNPSSYDVEDEPLTLGNPTREGYAFLGWYTEASFENQITEIAVGTIGNIELYAKWEPISYTITYENTKDAINANPTSFTIESETITLVDLTKDGYTFDGWFNGQTQVTEMAQGMVGNITLTAKWSVIGYEITYHNAEGATNSNPDTYDVEDEPLTLADAQKVGYTFKGWYTDSAFENAISEIAIGTIGNIDLYAKWEIIEYTATFKDGETVVDTVKFTVESSSITEPTVPEHAGYIGTWDNYTLSASDITINAVYELITYDIQYHNVEGATHNNPIKYNVEQQPLTLTDASKAHYIFKGWYTDSAFGSLIDEIPVGTIGIVHLYAKWEAVEYTATFKDGETVVDTVKFTVESSSIAEPVVPNHVGYTGVWENYALTPENITINAVYTPITYTVTYENTKDVPHNNATSYTIESQTITLFDLSKHGYTFDGWYNGDTKITEIPTGSTGNLTLIAKWTAIPYTITYSYDDNIGGPDTGVILKTTYTIEDEFDFEDLVNHTLGYNFMGWYTEKNVGTGTRVLGITKGTTGDKTYYAQWGLGVYTLTYHNVNGAANTNAETYTVETDTFTISDLAKAGYVFKGWYSDEALTAPATLTVTKGSTGNLHFYAKWEKINYTITYSLYGGSYAGTANPDHYTIEDAVTFANPTLAGHFFVGWYDLAEGGKLVTDIPVGTTGNITLYARYLAFDSKGGSAVNYTPVFGSTGVTKPENPTRAYYTFDAWYTNEALTAKFNFNKLPTESMTLYAKWIPIEYKITYILDDGTNDKNNPATYNVEDAFAFANATKTGYTFNGWYTDAAFTSALVEGITLGSHGEITLYANFSINKYTISFNTNGGTEVEPIKQNYATEVSAPEAPAKTGYKFVGWYSNSSLTSKYTFTTIPAKNITLYAKWELVSYKITYNLDGGTNATQNPKTYTITTNTITLRNPSKTGYTFGGWYTDELFANKITEITLGSYGEKELFAKWDIINYEIEYIVPEGTTNTNPTTYTIETDITPLVDASRAGYTFGGWFSNSACTVPVTSVAGGAVGKMTVYGKFTANTYEVWLEGKDTASVEVSFDLNGAEGSAPAVQTVTRSDKLTYPPIPTRQGYLFGGWYDNAACEGELFDFTAYLTENTTLYAKWLNLDGATAIAVGGTQSVTISGTTERVYRFVPLVSGNISITTEGSLDTFGMLYKGGTMVKQDDDSGEGDYGNFLIVYNVTAGQVYEIRVRGFAASTTGTVTLRVSGNNTVADGGTLRTVNQMTVTFGESFTVPAPTPVDNYKFLGWQSADGTVYTDAEGNSIRAWDISEDSVLYSAWEKMEYTVTFDTGSGSAIAPVKLGYGERLDINQYVTTRAGYYLVAWIYEGSAYEATTMPDHDITLTAQWRRYSLGVIKYSGKAAISVNDTITAELFGASCYAANGDVATVTVQYVDGAKTAGNTVTVILEANLEGADAITLRIENVKVYGMPTLTVSDTSKDYINLDNLAGSWFSASGKDTFGAAATIVVRPEEGKGAGDVATVYIDSVDAAGNVTTEAVENIKLYGKPVITYNTSKAEIGVNNTLNAELFSATAVDSFGEALSVSVTRYSGTIAAGNTVTLRISATDSKGNTTNIDVSVKVYGNPAITNAAKTGFKVEDSITIETLGITAKDTYNQPLTITLTAKSGTQAAGEIMVFTAAVTDAAGNVTTEDYTVKIYGTPTVEVGREAVKATEAISLNSFKVVSKDSFGIALTTTCELLSGTQTGGTYMTYRFTTTDRVGNTYSVDKQIGVYDIADINLTYNAYNSDFIKLTSKGEEFLFSATDSFGENCTLLIVTANGSPLTAGVTTDIYLVATDKAGNVVKSELIEDIKVYGTPTIEYMGDDEFIQAGTDLSTLSTKFVTTDSYGVNPKCTVTLDKSEYAPGEIITATVTATDVAGNQVTQVFTLVMDIEGYTFELQDDDTYTLVSYNGTATDVAVPEKVGGKTITVIAAYAFKDCTAIKKVVIPNTIIRIGASAFYGCTSLESITIPFVGVQKDGTTNTHFGYIFGASSYSDNGSRVPSSLKSVTITGGTRIGSSAFSGCTSLESITIPNSVTSIGDYAFSGCTGLESITIPNSVTSIGSYAFSGCTSLESITIPNSVTSINGYAFGGCTSLTSITIPNSVIGIGSAAFDGCTGLESITIPNSVTSIGDEAFYGCTGLESITIPNSVTSIGSYAFSGCTSLTSITIPNSVTSIGNAAFYDCTGLTSITIPNSVTSIGDHAFLDCTNLTSITIPNSVTSIGDYAFSGCYKLVEVYNLSSLTITKGSSSNGYVAYYALGVYTSATDASKLATTPEGYIFYEDGDTVYLLGYKGSETELTLPDKFNAKNYAIYKYAFYNCTSLESITIPNSVTSIGDYAFSGCTGLESITIPNSVTSIGDEAFYGCTSLESVTFEEGSKLTSIGYDAFLGCTGLTSITIPNSVTSIDNYAFRNCTSLTSITIPNSVTGIGSYAFSGCTSLTSITIPNSVIGIGSAAFDGCTSLKSVTFEEGSKLTRIGSSAFRGCTSLTSITIPNSVTSIGDYAFYGCSSLTSITFADTTTWYRTTSSDYKNGTKTSVTSASTNATYFKSTYENYYWYKA